MSLSIPRIPIKKSEKEIAVYLHYGPMFNKILLHMKDIIEEGINCDLESEFINICNNIFLRIEEVEAISFPFTDQKNYINKEFGHAICVSANNVVAHGQPTILKLGDIVSIDCGVFICFKSGLCLNFDSAFTTIFGEKPNKDSWIYKPQLALKEILNKQPKDTKSISKIIRHTAARSKLKQVVSMTGHGIGYNLHEPPAIHNAPATFSTVDLFDGLVFCAEPIYIEPENKNFNKFIVQTALGSNGWEVLTTSGEQSSHFETMFCFINGQLIDLIGVTEWEL